MSVGFLLRATLNIPLAPPNGGDPAITALRAMGDWITTHAAELKPSASQGQDLDGLPTLYCKLHPAAEDLEIRYVDRNHFEASANTSTVGPGYHIFVCELLHELAREFDAVWDPPTENHFDETGYFHQGDQERVFDEMTSWVEGVAGLFFDGTLSGTREVALSMPMEIKFHFPADALTAMGPRDIDWLKRTAAKGKQGRDFFAWWLPGLNAQYFLGRALARMWSDVRWRKPINDFEKATLHEVSDCLAAAYAMDRDLDYPWAEWREILEFLEDCDPRHAFVWERSRNAEPTIGYRRQDVSVELPGGWWITLDGSFSNFVPDEGDALSAQDPPRGVWYSGYAFPKDEASAHFEERRMQTRAMEMDLLVEREDFVAAARIKGSFENGEQFIVLTSTNICPTGRCICTIVFTRPEEREWALKVWQSLKPPTESQTEQ